MKLLPALAAVLLAVAAAGPAVAQNSSPAGSAKGDPGASGTHSSTDRLASAFVAFSGNADAGQRVASGGTRAGPGAACFNCHGMRGGGDTSGAFPRLAGQPAYYLFKQLENYADGSRANAVMTPIAVQMTPDERRNVAAYYASIAAPYRVADGLDPGMAQTGSTIAAVGSAPLGLQACVSCHGPGGQGMPPDVPYLAGQNVRYLELQLQLWQEGRRSNDPLGVMSDVAKRLSSELRRAVAVYFASLPPPRDSAP